MMTATAPTIRAGRLDLVPFSEDHLTPRYVSWLNDPEVVRYSEQRHRRHTLASCRAYRRSFEGTADYFWAIVAHDPALGHVGNLGASVDVHNRIADLAILIGEKSAWGLGYGTEGWSAACRYLLGPGGIRKVTAGTMAANAGMLAVMYRSGMVEDGRRRGHFLLDGRAVDVVHAALFAEDLPDKARTADGLEGNSI